MQTSHKTLYVLQGAVWLMVGAMLLNMGIRFLMSTLEEGKENGHLMLLILALILGQLKGRFMMKKVAMRSFDRISKMTQPVALHNIYTKGNYIVIGIMMLLGMGMKFLPVPLEARGFIDVAVGSALIQGSLFYFRLPATPQGITT